MNEPMQRLRAESWSGKGVTRHEKRVEKEERRRRRGVLAVLVLGAHNGMCSVFQCLHLISLPY